MKLGMKAEIRNSRAEKSCQRVLCKGNSQNGEQKEAGCMDAMWQKNVTDGVGRWRGKGKYPEEMMKATSH